MTAVLGINLNHADSSAALILDGKVVAAVAEERFGERIKHDPSFPGQAIRSVLSIGGISARELDFIAVPRDTTRSRSARVSYVLSHPFSGSMAALEHMRRAKVDLSIGEQVALACGEAPDQVKAEVVNVEHHLSHIASSYYCSPFESLTAGFSYDGSGDFVSAMAARCEGTRIEVLDRVHLPNSLGFFYTACCQFIGFDDFGEEYKVMGLAPYGNEAFVDVMREVARCTPWASKVSAALTIAAPLSPLSQHSSMRTRVTAVPSAGIGACTTSDWSPWSLPRRSIPSFRAPSCALAPATAMNDGSTSGPSRRCR